MPKILMLLGLAIFFCGLLLHFVPNALSWFGNLPGDIRYESETSSVFIPVTSMILISIAGSIIVSLFGRQ